MPKYMINVGVEFMQKFTVEADDAQSAREKAISMAKVTYESNQDYDFYIDSTIVLENKDIIVKNLKAGLIKVENVPKGYNVVKQGFKG